MVATRNTNNNKIVSVQIKEFEVKDGNNTVVNFINETSAGSFYQLSIPELNLLTSIPVSSLRQNGFNDTITFNLDPTSQNFVGFQIEYIDRIIAADKLSLKGNRRKRFLLPNFRHFNGKAQLSSFTDGIGLKFELMAYDSMGAEQKTKSQIIEEKEKVSAANSDDNKSFLQKYWM